MRPLRASRQREMRDPRQPVRLEKANRKNSSAGDYLICRYNSKFASLGVRPQHLGLQASPVYKVLCVRSTRVRRALAVCSWWGNTDAQQSTVSLEEECLAVGTSLVLPLA